MFDSINGNNIIELKSPVVGKATELSEVPDPVFSSGMLGNGVAIEPDTGVLFSPADGVINNIFPTKHAVGIITDDGIEILLHIGIDTVNLMGEGFESHVKRNDRVRMGDKLISFDLEGIKSKGKSVITPMVIVNMDIVDSIEYKYGKVDTDTAVITLKMKNN